MGDPDISEELGVAVPDWGELRRRRELDLYHTYGSTNGVVLQPSTFVPTSTSVPAAAAAVAPAAADAPAAAAPAASTAVAPAAQPVAAQGAGAPAVPVAAPAAAVPPPRTGPARAPTKVTKASKQKSGGRTYTSKFRGVHQTFPTRRWEAQFRCAAAAVTLTATPGGAFVLKAPPPEQVRTRAHCIWSLCDHLASTGSRCSTPTSHRPRLPVAPPPPAGAMASPHPWAASTWRSRPPGPTTR